MAEIAIALNKINLDEALKLAYQLRAEPVIFKVQDLLVSHGTDVIWRLKGQSHPRTKIMCDLKFKDIPSAVGTMVGILDKAQADLITVHGDGGVPMVKAAVDASSSRKIIVVTVLTSDEPNDADRERLLSLADVARESGAVGITCPALYLDAVRKTAFLKVTPGVRMSEDSVDDQKAVGTPDEVKSADIVVVGRPIINAPDRLMAYQRYRDAVAVTV